MLRAPHSLTDREPDPDKLRDLDAPELVNLAQADAVWSCRVAELVRVNGDAKQARLLATKTRCLFGHCLLVRC